MLFLMCHEARNANVLAHFSKIECIFPAFPRAFAIFLPNSIIRFAPYKIRSTLVA